ncbi:MAG: hypothetical protein U5K75_08645 [Ahrensia sp.]|nr:hypothetical protein [Ahrensia sp.]
MEKLISKLNHRGFTNSDDLFKSVDAVNTATLAALGSDITLLINEHGIVVDVAFKDRSLEVYGLDKWIGRTWRSTVTPECYDKIDALLAENPKRTESRESVKSITPPMDILICL